VADDLFKKHSKVILQFQTTIQKRVGSGNLPHNHVKAVGHWQWRNWRGAGGQMPPQQLRCGTLFRNGGPFGFFCF